MKLVRKIADVMLSTTVVVILATLLVYVAGRMGAVPY